LNHTIVVSINFNYFMGWKNIKRDTGGDKKFCELCFFYVLRQVINITADNLETYMIL